MQLVFAALAALQVASAEPAGHFAFRSYGSEQGLENLSVVSIRQDAEGFLWAATEDGAYRYDGDRFHRYSIDDGLLSNEITSLAAGDDGRFWAGTLRGLARFQDGRFQGGLFADQQIDSIAAAPGGRLWVATHRGLFVEGEDGRFAAAEGWPEGVGVDSVFADADAVVAAAASGEVYLLQQGSWRSYPIAGERIDGIARDRKGVIWARSAQHLWMLPRGADRFVDDSRLLPGTSDTGYLWLDAQGMLFLPTDSGLLYREDDEWHLLGAAEGLPASWARAAMQDREGSIWVGVTGLHRLVGRGLWRVYTAREGLPSEVVWSEWRDASGRLYVGTDKGLVRAAGGKFELVRGTEGHAIRAVAQTRDGALWAGGSPPELLRIDSRTGAAERFGAEQGVLGGKMLSLVVTSRGELLAGTDSGGLLRFDEQRRRFVQVAIPGGSVRERFAQIIEDRSGRVWAAGELGLAVRHKDEWRRYTEADGLRDQRTSYVVERRSGDICVAYRESLGLSCFQPTPHGLRALQHIDGTHGLQSSRVYLLGEDRNGRLWVGTGQGVDVFDAHGVEHFGEARGMAGDDCDATAFLSDANGDVWIGTSTGLGRFIGGNYTGPAEPPRPVIVEARVGGAVLARNGQRLEARDPALEVHFAGLSFLDEARVQHQVRLLPVEPEFRTAAIREARYAALAPGHYVFEVRARLPPGQWSEPARFEFSLLPRWWQTSWFRLLVAAGVTLTVGLIVKWRVRRLEVRNRELEQQVGTRTGELAAANQALRDLAVSDPLTGLKNRRYLELAMPETVAQVQRNLRAVPRRNADLLLLVIDLDDFKSVNDTFGHSAGDRVLQQAGRLVAQVCRESDSAVRWGGEEFVVVARNADRAMAGTLAERICDLFRAHEFEVGAGQRIRCTCSVGLAAFPFADEAELDWSEVVELADHCLYAAKRAGKDGWAMALPSDGLRPRELRRRLGTEFLQLVAEGQLLLSTSRPQVLEPEPVRSAH